MEEDDMATNTIIDHASTAGKTLHEHIETRLMREYPNGLQITEGRTVTLPVRVPSHLVRALRPGDLDRMKRQLSVTKGLSISLRPTFDLLGQKIVLIMRKAH